MPWLVQWVIIIIMIIIIIIIIAYEQIQDMKHSFV